MAVRGFASSGLERIVTATTGREVANGGFTIAALVKPQGVVNAGFVGLRASGVMVASLMQASAQLALDTDTLDVRGAVGLTVGAWQLIGVTHQAGTTIPRFHRWPIGGAWTHVDAAGAVTHPNVPGVVDQIILGAAGANGAFAQDAEIAWAALLPPLSDSNFEAIGTFLSSQAVYDLGALNLWNLNQADVGTAVADLVGTASEVSRVGTSVVSGDDPAGWNFTVTVPPPLVFSFRLSGGAANTNADLSIGGAVSSEHAPVTLLDAETNAERSAGHVDYRLIYAHNDDTADGNVTAYVPTQPDGGREIAIGVATQAVGAVVPAITNDLTPPAGVAFSAPADAGSAVNLGLIPAGSFRGLWIRRTEPAGAPEGPNLAKVRLRIARAG
jgi:hypothetical protein